MLLDLKLTRLLGSFCFQFQALTRFQLLRLINYRLADCYALIVADLAALCSYMDDPGGGHNLVVLIDRYDNELVVCPLPEFTARSLSDGEVADILITYIRQLYQPVILSAPVSVDDILNSLDVLLPAELYGCRSLLRRPQPEY